MEEADSNILNNSTQQVGGSVEADHYPFSDVKYICQSTTLIIQSIQKGFDVVQLPNGDVTVTEIKLVNVHYNWNPVKQKFVKVNQDELYI